MLDLIDKIRRRFLWQGSKLHKKKCFLVSWYRAYLAKEFGGLGILDLRQMNIALLLKWWWKFKDPTYTHLWKDIIVYKYYADYPVTSSNFWKEILKLDSLGHCSVTYQPGVHTRLHFLDRCLGSSPYFGYTISRTVLHL